MKTWRIPSRDDKEFSVFSNGVDTTEDNTSSQAKIRVSKHLISQWETQREMAFSAPFDGNRYELQLKLR